MPSGTSTLPYVFSPLFTPPTKPRCNTWAEGQCLKAVIRHRNRRSRFWLPAQILTFRESDVVNENESENNFEKKKDPKRRAYRFVWTWSIFRFLFRSLFRWRARSNPCDSGHYCIREESFRCWFFVSSMCWYFLAVSFFCLFIFFLLLDGWLGWWICIFFSRSLKLLAGLSWVPVFDFVGAWAFPSAYDAINAD